MPYKDPEKQKQAQRRHYLNNKETYIQKGMVSRTTVRQRNKKIVDELKNVPCADCHRSFPPECMDFDHVLGSKIDNVGTLASKNASLKRILEEVEKCEIICANCHRIRSKKRLSTSGG